MIKKKKNSFSVHFNKDYPSIVRGEGIYLYDDQGKRYVDASGGPLMSNLGHGLKEMAETIYNQAVKIEYVFRMDFTTPEMEAACTGICEASNGVMDRVFLVSGGSEATETTIKIARKYHIDAGNPSKFKIISRWMSYHGMTGGAMNLSGFPFRRKDYTPYISNNFHIPPAYCYRCWYNKAPETCNLECANALENEILCQGPETVAGFIAEPISGMSLCGAAPRLDYFKRIRQICDKYDVLLIMDEVLTGFGRSGKFFAYEHFDTPPDIMALGKGLGGGYFPVGAAVTNARVVDMIANNSGVFAPGHTWAGNPMAAAVISKTLEFLEEHQLVQRSAEMGVYLARQLEALHSHPTVGDIRGEGLMRGIEFVKDKETREPLPPEKKFWMVLHELAQKLGLVIESSFGCDRGQAGDQVMFGPPFIVTKTQIDDIVEIFDKVLTQAEKQIGF
ncbi:aminotransferase class III-fold pyridoxal phosphate-dependent enzyme [bacterium]|nr:aminotransferase class III-fold pyridoxal phosphate-dependent enzyme [bacterium]